jgi:hypothetical protein
MDILIKGTLKYIPIIGAAIAAATLPLFAYGLWLPFAGGLACGIGAAAAGFVVACKLMSRAVATGSRGAAFSGVVMRMLIYLLAMSVVTAAVGLWPGIGSAAGCLTAPAAVIVGNILVPKLRRLRGRPTGEEDRQYIYETHIRGANGALRYVFIRGSYMEKAYGGRVYMTHRRFRRLAAIRRAPSGGPPEGSSGGSRKGSKPTGTGGTRA